MTSPLTYLSICSGIEAATVAWHGLGWRAVGFSEIEAFPRAVLKHHYPNVPLHGDFTQLIDAPPDVDLLVGGTPCQAFSVAGKRASLEDARGNLSLAFIELANAIDDLRFDRGQVPCIVVWENVPGVLSVKDNAFGCFLGGLVGCDAALIPTGGRWTNAGMVAGPKRRAAWRVLDAQYFGLAQRRARVFVVASARDGFDPATVLFEPEGVRRHFAPRREAGERTAPTLAARTKGNGGLGTDAELDGALIAMSTEDVAKTLLSSSGRLDGETETFVAHTLKAEGHDASEDGTGRNVPFVLASGQANAGLVRDGSPALTCLADVPIVCHAFDAKQSSANKHGNIVNLVNDESRSVAIGIAPENPVPPLVARSSRGGAQTLSPGHNTDGHIVAVPQIFSIMPQNSGKDYKARPVDVAQPLMAGGPVSGNQGGDFILQLIAHAFDARQSDVFSSDEGRHIVGALAANTGPNGNDAGNFACNQAVDAGHVLPTAMQVRRLTPMECERLQGFPDYYTAIPWRGKNGTPDGPRYKALGNSMAVPVMRWIGKRIDDCLKTP